MQYEVMNSVFFLAYEGMSKKTAQQVFQLAQTVETREPKTQGRQKVLMGAVERSSATVKDSVGKVA